MSFNNFKCPDDKVVNRRTQVTNRVINQGLGKKLIFTTKISYCYYIYYFFTNNFFSSKLEFIKRKIKT